MVNIIVWFDVAIQKCKLFRRHIFLMNGLLGRICATLYNDKTHLRYSFITQTHTKSIVKCILFWHKYNHRLYMALINYRLHTSYSPAWDEISWTWDFKQSIISIIIDTGGGERKVVPHCKDLQYHNFNIQCISLHKIFWWAENNLNKQTYLLALFVLSW